jgi:plastocyanin
MKQSFITISIITLSFIAVPAFAQERLIQMNNGNFSPKVITIPVGATVTWKNAGHDGHSVMSDTGLFNSGPMKQNQTFSYVFKTPGTFAYYCKDDGKPGGVGMAGKIVVARGPMPAIAQPAPNEDDINGDEDDYGNGNGDYDGDVDGDDMDENGY